MSDQKDEEKRDSKKRKWDESDPIDMPGTSARTPSPGLPLWVAGGSPAKHVTGEELLKMSAALDNLSIIHEIAIDPNFKIPEKPANPIARENFYKAFYDVLEADLKKEPPIYKHAFNLLLEMKQIIVNDILNERQVRMKAEIESTLNEEKLRDKLEQDAFDVLEVSQYVLNVLGRLCAPARDQVVEKLKREAEIVPLIKGIFELIELIKTDLANYELSVNREAIEEYSAKLEFDDFNKMLKNNPFGADQTKAWIKASYNRLTTVVDEQRAHENGLPGKRTKPDEPSTSTGDSGSEERKINDLLNDVTSTGYISLVEKLLVEIFPETLLLDRPQIAALAEKFLQMEIVCTLVFVTCNAAGKRISELPDFKRELKNRLVIISNDIDDKNLSNQLDALAEECAKQVRERAETEEEKQVLEGLKQQLTGIENEQHKVRTLVHNRISEFVCEMLRHPISVPRRLLPGLSVIQSELGAFMSRYLRICQHNRRTFNVLYEDILKDLVPKEEAFRMVYPRHPNAVVVAPPTVTISPLIRAGRYAALGLGIIYGFFRLRHYCEYHADIRDWEHEKAVAKAEEAAKQKKWADKDGTRYLLKMMNIPFQDGVSMLGMEDLFRED
ncbi:hypothetical protein WR25_14501 [Diploscapter pachys]|uniref:Uncharacterized protein n=1 Tax=Diploscapter pachys TaxID=2018661 RepID=A0A2A2KYY8_9BILA|nr:hypothetical protein WR25_14501 [Diploscapter pachys]